MSTKLTAKQSRFVEEYLVDLNATQAAIRASYSAETATSIGSENLRKPDIAAAIEAGIAARSARTRVMQDRVIKELERLAFSDIRRLMTWGPGGVKLKDSAELDDDAAACVSEVVETTSQSGGSLRLKVHDKKGALDSLARHLGVNPESLAERATIELHQHLHVEASDSALGRVLEKLDTKAAEKRTAGVKLINGKASGARNGHGNGHAEGEE